MILYLQDILSECIKPEKFKVDPKEQGDTLIFDFGSWQCRVGWSHKTEPSFVFDSIVHRWKDDNGVSMIKVGRGTPSGPNIRANSRSAFENGLPVHTPSIELIFDFILSHFRNEKKGISLIMTESPLIPQYCRQEVMELIFEGYNCIERVAFVLDGPVALPKRVPTALSIHIGANSTHIHPIIDGSIDWSHVKRINWGGMIAVEFLLKILGLKYPGILNLSNPNKLTVQQVQVIWQKSSLIASDISNYECQMDSLSRVNSATLATINFCIRLTGDAASEAQRRQDVAEAKKAAALNQVALQEKRKILADKLRQKSEEQREAKLKSKEHIYKALQGLVERVQLTLKKSIVVKKRNNVVNEDEDISMDFSDESEEDAESFGGDEFTFTPQNISDIKLFEELKRLGFKSFIGLQEGLRRAEEDFFRLSGQSIASTTTPTDFSLLNVPDVELSEAEIREKRRLRLIKSSADARERQKAEKAAEDARKQALSESLELKRQNDLEGWRNDLYGKRKEIIDRIVRKQKQRADRKSAAQGSRFRSVVTLGESNDDTVNSNSTATGGHSISGQSDSGPDDGFGLNDDDWLVYRQVSREDEEDTDLIDQESLSQIESLLEEKDHDEFIHVLQQEQYSSLTILDRLTFGDDSFEPEFASININAERFRCTEGLFQPLSIQGIDQAGLIEVLSNIFSFYPREILLELIKNIHVTGGPASIPGLKDRLINELSSILPESLVPHLNISISNDLEATWKGIQDRAKDNLENFNWITRDKYFENKPTEEPLILSDSKKKKKVSIVKSSNIPENIFVDNSHLNNKSCSNPY